MSEKRDTIVLVDFSGISWTCWEPALSAEETQKKALATHLENCAACAVGEMCTNRPKQYDAKVVLLENLDLKFQTLFEALCLPVKTWVMVKDGKDTRRRELLPEYKANREEKPFDPRPLAETHIRTKGCRFCWCPTAEADDAIATMARDLRDAGKDVVIVTSDKDLWQVWDPPRIRIYMPVKKEFLSKEYVNKKFPERSKTSKTPGIDDVKHVRLCKALWGDPSDNIPNVMPRMQADLAPIIKASTGELDDFLQRCYTQAGPKVADKVNNAEYGIRTNYEVVGLYTDVVVTWLP